jgi:hypothetical protein
VGDVRLGHEKAIIANSGNSSATAGAPVNGDEFPNPRALANFGSGLLAGEFQILGRQSDGNKREEVAFVADTRAAIDNAVPVDAHAISQHYFIADNRVRANRAIAAKLRGGTDNCAGVNLAGRILN